MMTAKAEEGSSLIMDELFRADDETNDVVLDLDSFWRVMGEPPESSQGCMLEGLASTSVLEGLHDSKELLSPRAELPGFGVQSSSQNSEASGSRTGCSEGLPESAGNSLVTDGERLEPSSQLSFAEHCFPRSITDCKPAQSNVISYSRANEGSEMPSSYCQNDSEKASFDAPKHNDKWSSYGANHIICNGDSSIIGHPNHEESLFECPVVDPRSENLYHNLPMEETNNSASVARMEDISVIDGYMISQESSCTESNSFEIDRVDIPDLLSENGMYLISSDDPAYFPYNSGFKSLACDVGSMVNILDEGKDPPRDLVGMMPYEDLAGNNFRHHFSKNGNGGTVSLDSQVGFTKSSNRRAKLNKSGKPFSNTLSNALSLVEDGINVKNNVESVTSNEIVSRASEVIDDVITRKYYGGSGMLPAAEFRAWPASNSLSSVSYKNYSARAKEEREDILPESNGAFISPVMVGETPIEASVVAHDGNPVPWMSGQPGIRASASIKSEINCLNMETEMVKLNGHSHSNINYQGVTIGTVEQSDLDYDSDVCILEGMSAPAPRHPTGMNGKLVPAPQLSMCKGPIREVAVGHSRPKPNDERAIFRVALQDLSQPKSEAIPPDGVLAVPLLKHQRIALSWMVNKETKSACCSGGILADDQGLGKTVSTIALILKERSPSSKAPKANNVQWQTEMLNLDEDDGVSGVRHIKEPCEADGYNRCLQAMGRPAGGTLIVCPTSVLRQWSEELHNKVTSEAGLSVLVYHGSNRTKDHLELAKYDVVITTYAIVSMEVPKQHLVDENDDQCSTSFKGFSSSKKRRLLETASGRKLSVSKKSKNGSGTDLLDVSGPLAKVGWFRVVLDEAQSIKNHRTQVARACWALRAKRRWCLSGTPIQNAIDDLYSYFRFLRHEPYATFRTFYEQLKAPIQRNPRDGYKKLQAVLKTIMLRRTKGTFIDGEPIIILPPKMIELKKVDFSKEERDFYCRLEADSRAQFAEYAAAGTVKQNYVNILLMLLRLRQACDHPLLVKGFNSNSKLTYSIEIARKLPQEKLIFLLNCLEASLAICGICSDPPEDAVVGVCGHVFCNQCICEHMIGDDSQCPTKSCKIHLSTSRVFSVTTLRIAMSDQLSAESISNSSVSDLAKSSEPCSLNCPLDSSKIKAALEILLSLSKPQDHALRTSSSDVKGCCGSEMMDLCDSREENGTSDTNIDLPNSVKVVGEKAIVFSQWTRMLDLLEACLKNSSIQYRRLDGTMPVVARDRAVKDFNSLPQVTVMIMSLKAASLGLNMVAACNVILLDLWWNPTTEDQAVDRAHRIGQTRPVSVFRLTVKDTVEDRILALQQRKREMVASAFGEDGTGSRQTKLTVEDLKYLFRV